jgi:hypothetical protein
VPADLREVDVVTPYDSASFTAGKDTGTRISACIARLAALELIEDSRWWNRWRHRLMARALVACAEELESAADESGPELATGEALSFQSPRGRNHGGAPQRRAGER